MNGSGAANAALLDGIVSGLSAAEHVEVLVCPPYPYLAGTGEKIAGRGISLGAQNVSEHGNGAYTGEVSCPMLLDVGCRYVIVGHSERRAMYGETNEVVAAKYRAAQEAGLVPVLCVGETLEERETGKTEQVVDEQLAAVIEESGAGSFAASVIAYEPVWAIGTGRTATPEQAQAVHEHIRGAIAADAPDIAARVRILYGGSMKGSNAAGLLSQKDIDGGLIGGASLVADEFLSIVAAANELER